jgi:hypothetical protein
LARTPTDRSDSEPGWKGAAEEGRVVPAKELRSENGDASDTCTASLAAEQGISAMEDACREKMPWADDIVVWRDRLGGGRPASRSDGFLSGV